MKIGPVNEGSGPERPDQKHLEETRASRETDRHQPARDAVDISPEGRSMAQRARQVTEVPADRRDPLSAENRDDAVAAYRDDDTADLRELLAEDLAALDDSQSEVRADKIARAKEHIESGHYSRRDVHETIAQRITDTFLGE